MTRSSAQPTTFVELVSFSTLASIDVVSIRAGRDPAFLEPSLEMSEEVQTELTLQAPKVPRSEGTSFIVKLECLWVAANESRPVAHVEVALRVAYLFRGLSKAPSGDLLAEFGHQAAVHHAWPFLRERVRALSNELGLPQFLLPLRQFQLAGKQVNPDDILKQQPNPQGHALPNPRKPRPTHRASGR